MAVAGLMVAVLGFATACSASTSASSTPSSSASSTAQPPGPGGAGGEGGSNARSGAAAGGTAGTITEVSDTGFTLTTGAGQAVTITRSDSTTYLNGTAKATASIVAQGATVLVLGTANGTAITAAQVIAQSADVGSTAASTAAGVVPFERGAPSAAKQTGAIPANYTEGSGTIVSGDTAYKATEAALAAYPGGVVDRVVQLSSGEYEVHYVGVNWPHHIFVDANFKVVGAS
jgi:preprotein translocase subunit YajC